MTLKESLLWPLSVIYGNLARLRAGAYRKGIFRQRHLDGVVISVGNLTVGGTGKTPMVLMVAERLLAEGKSVGVLTRGYRGKIVAAPEVKPPTTAGSEGHHTSDEVRLLRSRFGERVLFGVGANRYKSGSALASRGVKWFILDDGFQHLQLARDVDVVLIDASNPFGGGHVLPAGHLREPRSALWRADMIVITRSNHAPAIESVVRRHSEAPIFYARTKLASAYSRSRPQLTEKEARGERLFAFCGIGNPAAFIADLRDWGFQIIGHKCFRDHYRYSPSDIAQIEKEAAEAGAAGLICTEKDSFNLPGVSPAMDLWICSISLQVDREEDFWQAVMRKSQSRVREAK